MGMKVTLKDNVLRIELPLKRPNSSNTGKIRVVATTKGPVNTGIQYHGSEIVIDAQAFIESILDKQRNDEGYWIEP